MKKQTDYNKRSEKKHDKVRFVALIRKQLREECRGSKIPYADIVEAGLKELMKNGKR